AHMNTLRRSRVHYTRDVAVARVDAQQRGGRTNGALAGLQGNGIANDAIARSQVALRTQGYVAGEGRGHLAHMQVTLHGIDIDVTQGGGIESGADFNAQLSLV